MPLPISVDSRDGIPEGMEEHYQETESGAFKLDLDGNIKTQDDIDALETVVQKERNLRREAEKQAKKLPEDFDPEEWQRLKELEAKQDKGKSSKKDDAELQRLQDKYEARLEEANSKVEKYQSTLYNRLKEQDLEKHLRRSNVAEQFLPAVKAMLKDQVKIIEEDDDIKAVAGVAEKDLGTFVEEWAKSDEGKAYVSAPDTSGGGSRKGSGGGVGTVKSKADLKNETEKSKYVKEHGLAAFRALPNN